MKYKLIIFDMDGTILNTLSDLTASVNYALTACGLPSRTEKEVRSFVGNGIHKLIERAVPVNTSNKIVEKVFMSFCGHYALHCADQTKPYQGITALLRELSELKIKTAVVSNKADFAVQSLCKQYFDSLFSFSLGEKEGIRRKPAPDMVNHVLKELHIAREDAVYIGDSEVDIETAKNADMDCISVSWGFRDKDLLKQKGASLIIENPEELRKLLI